MTEQAQIYATIIGPGHVTFVDNTGIMTYYEVKHLTEDELTQLDENERIAKEQEAAEK